MMIINGIEYATIADAAGEFGVSQKTVRYWIERGIISRPPKVTYGVREIYHFPSEFMDQAKQEMRRYRERRNNHK